MQSNEYERALMPDKPVDFDEVPWLEMGPTVVMDDPFEPGAVSLRRNPFCTDVERVGSFKQYLMGQFFRDYIIFMKKQIQDAMLPGLDQRFRRHGRFIFSANHLEIERIEFYMKSQSEIYSDIIFAADIQGAPLKQLYAPVYFSEKYRLRTCSSLSPESLSFNHIIGLTVYSKKDPSPGIPLDDYLIPYTGSGLLEMESDIFLSEFYPEALRSPQVLNGQTLASRMGLSVQYLHIADRPDVRGQIYFEQQPLKVISTAGDHITISVPGNTIVVNLGCSALQNSASSKDKTNDTIVHECFHAYRHRLFYLGQRLYNNSLQCLSCNTYYQGVASSMDLSMILLNNSNPARAADAADRLSMKSPVDWVEWQANRVTPRIRMPAQSFTRKAEELMAGYADLPETEKLTRTITDLSSVFGVSKQSAKLRMVELGWVSAKGVLNYVDGHYVENYSVNADAAAQNETYTIALADALQLFQTSDKFRAAIQSGRYQYVDGHYCLADRKYLYRRNGLPFLTQYAKEHMAECCLAFKVQKAKRHQDYQEGVLKQQSGYADPFALYLSQEANSDVLWAASQKLSDMVTKLPPKAGPTLCFHMSHRRVTADMLTARSGVSVRTLTRLRGASFYRPEKGIALAVCIGLKLEPILSFDWLNKMGIKLTTSPEDILYQFILNSMYWQPVSEVNRVLQSFGFSPLSKSTDQLAN